MKETRIITNFLQTEAGNEAHLKMGVTHDEILGDNLSVTVIATGFHGNKKTYVLNEVVQQPIVQQNIIPQAIQIETITVDNSYVNVPNHVQPIDNIVQKPTQEQAPVFAPTVTDIFNTNNAENEQPYSQQTAPSNYGQQPRQEIHRHERESLLSDENVPSFIAKKINLYQAPSSADVNISRFSLNADTSNDDRDFTIRPNRHLHDNVD
jgi:cell division protein FtsZ